MAILTKLKFGRQFFCGHSYTESKEGPKKSLVASEVRERLSEIIGQTGGRSDMVSTHGNYLVWIKLVQGKVQY